ncbi:MAG: hypothetical protein VX223_15145 [Myxococcota bacterium]|nr:hypothetical protein [Myxococcota bacterium]
MNRSVLGLFLVLAGVSIAAVFGARNIAPVNDALAQDGAVNGATSAAKALYDQYCSALTASLEENPSYRAAALVDHCITSEKADSVTEPAESTSKGPEASRGQHPSIEVALLSRQAAHEKLQARVALEDEALRAARDAWIAAEASAIKPQAERDADPKVSPEPTARLTAWFSLAGLPFLLGLGLIIGGGMLARQAQREAALSDNPEDSGTAGPVDFGELLDDLHSRVIALEKTTTGKVSHDELLAQIEAIQFEQLEPLIDARQKVQARFGMAGFADIYSPLSGGERNLNRAWSALVDRHPQEAQNALDSAAQQIVEAKSALARHAKMS